MVLTEFLCYIDAIFIPWYWSAFTKVFERSWILSIKIFWANLILTLERESRRFSLLFLSSSYSAWGRGLLHDPEYHIGDNAVLTPTTKLGGVGGTTAGPTAHCRWAWGAAGCSAQLRRSWGRNDSHKPGWWWCVSSSIIAFKIFIEITFFPSKN